jgi:glycosyltransferase involved in cell wall biosynthesis
MFTVYPSLYEGWGLPVAESLTLGQFCIASSTSSLPEVGGDLIEYIDPWDVYKWAERIHWYATHPDELHQKKEAIRANYQPYQWQETGKIITDKALALLHTERS